MLVVKLIQQYTSGFYSYKHKYSDSNYILVGTGCVIR